MTAQHEHRNKQQREGSCSDLQGHFMLRYAEPNAARSRQTYTAVTPKATILVSWRPSIRFSSASALLHQTRKSIPCSNREQVAIFHVGPRTGRKGLRYWRRKK